MIRSEWLVVALLLIAVARATRLIVEDVVLDRPRVWLIDHAGSYVATLVTCPWCASVWLGLAGGALVYFEGRSWPVQVGLLALAASQAAGLIALVVGVMEKAVSD